MFVFLSFVGENVHSSLVFRFKVFANLFDNVKKNVGNVLLLLFFLLVHPSHKLNQRVLNFLGRSIIKNIHNEVLNQILPRMKVLRSLIIHQPRIMKFVKSTKIHRNFIIQPHQFRRFIKIPEMLVVVDNFNKSLDQFPVDVHGVLIKAIIEVISQFLILRFPICWVGQVVFIEGVLEYVFGFHHVHRTAVGSALITTHYIKLLQKIKLDFLWINFISLFCGDILYILKWQFV